jgi:hypothetical protein
LRQSLDWLRDELASLYETKAKEFLRDPWKARNDYVSVILDRSLQNQNKFFGENATRDLDENEKVTVRKLLELQRHAMLMYTSCGWFFDEVSGLESVQVVQYAARALQLAHDIFGKDLEPGFLERFQHAKSNLPSNGDGRTIFNRFVKPAMIDWPKTTAHYGISSVFQQYATRTRIFSYSFEDEDRQVLSSGKTRLAVGRTRVSSEITQESQVLIYAMFYMGEHNLTGGVRYFDSKEAYEGVLGDLKGAYERVDFPEVIRAIDRHFGSVTYSLHSLFKDEQRRILKEILASTREDLESRFRLIAERYAPLMKFLQDAGAPLPQGLDTVTDFVLHADIARLIESESVDLDRLRSLIEEARSRGAQALDSNLSFVVAHKLEHMMQELSAEPEDLERLRSLQSLAELMMPLSLGLNLSKVQNTYWGMCQKALPAYNERATAGDESAKDWVDHFLALGETLGFAVKRLKAPPALVKMAA